MPKRPLGVLSLGVLIVALAISAFVFASDISAIFSITITIFGLWVMVLAGIRMSNPEMYGRGAFNVFSGGILITAFGSVWFLYGKVPDEYLLSVLLLVVGILIAVAGIRAWRK